MTYDFDAQIDRRESDCLKWSSFGGDVLPMWVADMDFKTPDAVVQALRERADHCVFGYPDSMPELREVLIARLASRHGMTVLPNELVYVPGIVMGLNFAAQVVCKTGGEIVTLTPVYPPFLNIPKDNDRTLNIATLAVSREDNRLHYEIDFDALEAAVTPESKMFILCSPHNPVGRVWTRSELDRIADFCLRHKLIIVSDEIHCDLVYPEYQHLSIASLSPEVAASTITLLAPSKTFNVPGLGMGFAVIQQPDLLMRYSKWTYSMGAGVNVMGFAGALAAYTEGQAWLDAVLAYLKGNRDFVTAFVDENMPDIPTTCPEGTYLLWLDCNALTLPEGQTPQSWFLSKGRVAFNDGASFGAGGEGFIRLNYATNRSTLQDGLNRMKAAYAQAKAV